MDNKNDARQLISSVLERIFMFILLIICRFYRASETNMGIEIVQTRVYVCVVCQLILI